MRPLALFWKIFDSVHVELSVPGKGLKAARGVTAVVVLIPIVRPVQHHLCYHRIVWVGCKRLLQMRGRSEDCCAKDILKGRQTL